jgi:hypothetical protein
MTLAIPTQSYIKLDFRVGKINDESMSLIIINGAEKKVYSTLDEQLCCELIIDFPAQVKIIVFNKGPNDTIVDENQNVIKDKFIQLENLQVDNLQCNPLYLKNKIKLTTNDGRIFYDNYWGFNGEVTLDFSQKNSIFWAFETNSLKP